MANGKGDMFPMNEVLENQNMRKLIWIIYGPPGIGKSTFIAQAGKVLFLSTDGGTKFIKSMARPIDSWITFKKYVKALSIEQPTQYTSICIDLISSVHRLCVKYVCEQRNITHLSDEKYSKAYEIARGEFETEMVKLAALKQYGIFFVTHSKEMDVKTRFSEITKVVPVIGKQAYDTIHPMADVMAYYGFDPNGQGGEMGRRMYFQPTESMEAKDRTTVLPESVFIPHPDEENGFELVERYLMEGKQMGASPKSGGAEEEEEEEQPARKTGKKKIAL